MKILPLFLIGILVLSGFGVYAIESDDSEEINNESQGVIRVTARGGRGITVIIRNWGNAPIDLRDIGMIFIDFNCYIITKKHLVYNIPDIIPAGGSLKIKTSDYDRLFGLGFCGVTITIFLDGDNNIDGQATKSGFIVGPFIQLGQMDII